MPDILFSNHYTVVSGVIDLIISLCVMIGMYCTIRYPKIRQEIEEDRDAISRAMSGKSVTKKERESIQLTLSTNTLIGPGFILAGLAFYSPLSFIIGTYMVGASLYTAYCIKTSNK